MTQLVKSGNATRGLLPASVQGEPHRRKMTTPMDVGALRWLRENGQRNERKKENNPASNQEGFWKGVGFRRSFKAALFTKAASHP
jgi:hypothetical protein